MVRSAGGTPKTREGAVGRTPLSIVGTLLLQACAAGMVTEVREVELPPRPRSVSRLAVMPLTTEPGSEFLRPELGEALARSLAERFPAIEIVGPELSRERLARTAATEYADLIDDYDRSGVVAPERVAEVTDALEVDHFLHIRAGYVREDFLDTYLFDDDLVIEERQILAAVARLWARDGPAPVWEAVVRTRSETDDFDTRSRRRDELIGELAGALGERLPIEVPTSGPK